MPAKQVKRISHKKSNNDSPTIMGNKLKKLNEEELLVIDSEDDEETLVEIVKQKRKVKIQNKAKTSNLNQRKQFSDRILYCDRPLYKINEQKGSKENKQKYIELQTGIFELLKQHLVPSIDSMEDVEVTKDPKCETYGRDQAEERYNLDLNYKYNDQKYEIKLLIFNTTCSMLVLCKASSQEENTISQIFIKNILFVFLEQLKLNYKTSQLNDLYRKMAVLGAKGSGNTKRDCFQCKTSEDDKSLQCQHCSRIIHEKCLAHIIDESDIKSTIALKDIFNCPSCLINPAKIDTEVKSVNEMQILMRSAQMLLKINQEIRPEVSNLAIEANTQEIRADDSEKDDNVSPLKNFAGFDALNKEGNNSDNNQKENMINISKISQQSTQKDDCENCGELLKTKSNLETQLMDHANQNLEAMETLAAKTKENDKLKEDMMLLKQELENTIKEVESKKQQLEEQTKSDSANAEDINITRLRKAYASLEKEKKKQEDMNMKKITELEKARIEAQEELKLATKKQKDAEDEKVTVVKIFECMRQLIDGGSVNIPVFQNKSNFNSGAIKKFSCTECGYQGQNESNLNQHKKDKHLQDLLVNYPCEICDYNAVNIDDLRVHKQSTHEYKCEVCNHIVTTNYQLTKHKAEEHGKDRISCTKCDSTLRTKQGLRAHMQLFHGKPEQFSCQECDYTTMSEPEIEYHKASHKTKAKFHSQPEYYACHKCPFTTENEAELELHKAKQHETQCYNHGNDKDIRQSQKEKRGKQYCHYWNYSSCKFGVQCRFLHEEIPSCRYQENCYKETCPFFHVVSRKTRNLFPQKSQPLRHGRSNLI